MKNNGNKNENKINKEFYRDFIDTLAHKRAELNTEIKAMEHAFERDEADECDNHEYKGLLKGFNYYTKIQTFFMETNRWAEFKNLETLKLYMEVINRNYKAMDEYSKAILSIDASELIGVTQEEWDKIEAIRYELREKMLAWSTFVEFCEHGTIL